jgi:hypothetical protein
MHFMRFMHLQERWYGWKGIEQGVGDERWMEAVG